MTDLVWTTPERLAECAGKSAAWQSPCGKHFTIDDKPECSTLEIVVLVPGPRGGHRLTLWIGRSYVKEQGGVIPALEAWLASDWDEL